MSSYQKFTLVTFAKKLKNGDYANATGANRAIGKTQELSETEKQKAKAMVARHFGVDEAPAKKVAKKAAKKAAKKVAKKAAKKVAKKVAKKAAKKVAKKAAVKPAKKAVKHRQPAPQEPVVAPKKKKASKKAAKKTARKPAPVAPAADAESAPVVESAAAPEIPAGFVEKTPFLERAKHLPLSKSAPNMAANDVVTIVGAIVATVDSAISAMDRAKAICPKADLDAGVHTAHKAMNKAMTILDQSVLSPMVKEPVVENQPAKPAAGGTAKSLTRSLPKSNGKPSPAATPAAENNSPKKGKRSRAASASNVEEPPPGPQRGADGKVIIDQDLLDDPSLSDEERVEQMFMRSAKRASNRHPQVS